MVRIKRVESMAEAEKFFLSEQMSVGLPMVRAAAAKAYYTEKARQDYYSEGQEILGNWGGKGAERLAAR